MFNPCLHGRPILGLLMVFEGKFILKEGAMKVKLGILAFLMNFLVNRDDPIPI